MKKKGPNNDTNDEYLKSVGVKPRQNPIEPSDMNVRFAQSNIPL